MTVQNYARQIEHLLLTGAIEGPDILRMHYLLQAYGVGKVGDKVVQKAIDQHDPEKVQQWLDDNLPPLFD